MADHFDYDPVFRALADPTRREVLAAVAREERSVMETARALRWLVSASAVSRHLTVLRGAGLVAEEPTGGLHGVRLQLASRKPIEDAFASLLKMWDR